MRLYLDSSAIVKLVQREAESDALRQFLRRHRVDGLMTSSISRVEVVRAVLPGGVTAIGQARRQLARMDQVTLTGQILDRAATLTPVTTAGLLLRSLDAIHLACAEVAGAELRAVVTYDHRMAGAAANLGLVVESPA